MLIFESRAKPDYLKKKIGSQWVHASTLHVFCKLLVRYSGWESYYTHVCQEWFTMTSCSRCQAYSNAEVYESVKVSVIRQSRSRSKGPSDELLLNSLTIVVYVRKYVVALYGPIFASCNSVP